MDHTNPQAPFDDMQFKQYQDFHPFVTPAGHDRMSSSAHSRSDAITSQNIHGHPHLSRQNSTQTSGVILEALASGNYMPPSQQHDLYPAPPQIDQSIPPLSHPSATRHSGYPQSWPPYDHALSVNGPPGLSLSYDSFPSSSPYPPPRLSPPPLFGNGGLPQPGRPLAGSLDPATGIFYRTPDHPRLRTAQACEKCRTRKAKCSGEHPSCKRCTSRGLVCEYAKEGRVRGPNKPKMKPANLGDDPDRGEGSRVRTSSANTSSSAGSSEHQDIPPISNSLRDSRLPGQTLPGSRRNSLSLGENRANRPRPPNLQLDASSNHYRLQGPPGDAPSRIDMAHQVNTREQFSHQHPSPRRAYRQPIAAMTEMSQGISHDPNIIPPYHPFTLHPSMAMVNPPYHEAVIPTGPQHIPSGFALMQAAIFQQQREEAEANQVPLTANGTAPLSQYQVPTERSPSGFEMGPQFHEGNSMQQSTSSSGMRPSSTMHFNAQEAHIHMELESLHQRADVPNGSTPQGITPNLPPTWVEIHPASSTPSITESRSASVGSSFHSGYETQDEVLESRHLGRSGFARVPQSVLSRDSDGTLRPGHGSHSPGNGAIEGHPLDHGQDMSASPVEDPRNATAEGSAGPGGHIPMHYDYTLI